MRAILDVVERQSDWHTMSIKLLRIRHEIEFLAEMQRGGAAERKREKNGVKNTPSRLCVLVSVQEIMEDG